MTSFILQHLNHLHLTSCHINFDTGVSRQNFNLEVNAVDYGFEPTNTPRTDRSVEFLSSLLFSFLHGLSSDLSFDENTLGSRQPHS